MSRVAIIGGGAAGMMAGIAAGICGHEVHIYEKNEKLGKKIYITGKGRCNLTNASDMETILKNVVTNPKFMYSALYTLSNDMVIDMFNNEMGVETKTERGNRVFPVSDKASDVTGGLTRRLHELGVNIHLGCDIKDILCEEIEGGSKKTVSGIIFKDGTVEKADSVIVATGGFSYRSTGSDGAGYEFAKKTEDNDAVKHMQALAKELSIVIPVSFYEAGDNRQLFNSVAVINAEIGRASCRERV